jgi:putative ABC transport system permease protein
VLIINQIIESFKFAMHALRNNKLRTFLSLLGITIGISAIILVYSVVDSLERNIRDSVNELGDNILYVQKWPFGGGAEFPWWKYLNRPEPLPADAEALASRLTTSQDVVFVFGVSGTAKFKSNSVEAVNVNGATHGFADVWDFKLSDGRYFTESESNSGKPYAIIGADVAEGLFNTTNAVGKRIKVLGRKVSVVGVFEKSGTSLVGQNYDQMVHVPAAYLRKLRNPRTTQGNVVMIKAKPAISVDQLSDEVRGHLRAIHRLKPKVDDDFSLNEISMLSQSLDSLFGVLSIAGTIIGGFSILVGGFGIANIMFVSVKERTSEIGIQKALGAKNSFILIQFLFESVMLCLVGGAIGLIMVAPLVKVLSRSFEFELFLSLGNVILGVSLSLIIGLISGIIPAIMASRMSPVDAIRFKM